MANIKVSEMTEATSFDDGDYTMIVQANQNKKISKENMLSDIPTIQNNITTINNNIGNLSNLTTPITTNLVEAINSVVESGSNENGNYIKYADGTMICTGKKSNTASASTQWGGIYATPTQSGLPYPQTFIEVPICQMGIACNNANGILMMISAGTTTNTPDFNFIRGTSGNVIGTINYTAIGKWK